MGTNDALFTNSDGEVKKTGIMAGWVSPDIKVGLKGLSKINIIGDVMTGKNILGGGGAGLNLGLQRLHRSDCWPGVLCR